MASDEAPTRRGDPDDYQTRAGLVVGQLVFGRFTLEALAGRGGMGVVWRARDEKLERTVALKFLPELVTANAEAVNDLKRETRRALDLTHPNIVRIYDLLQDDRFAAIAMEYIDGKSLGALKLEQPNGHFEVNQISDWVRSLCQALSYAHEKAKVVHRDLKPTNLIISSKGELKITDFGISATIADTATRVSGMAGTSGTPAYMSPQQMLGEKSKPTDDIYSLGATLYELLTGKPPFHTGKIVLQVQSKTPPRMTERRTELGVAGQSIPGAWERTVADCLSKESAARPANMRTIAERLSLEEYAQDVNDTEQRGIVPIALQPGAEGDLHLVPKSRLKGSSRKAKMPIVGALAAALLLGLGGWWYFGWHVPAVAAEQAHREALGWVTGLPLTASDNEMTAAQDKLEAYARAVSPERAREVRSAFDKQRGLIAAERERIHLANARGGIIVRTEPAGAEVMIGSFEHGKSPITVKEVPLGRYPVIARLDNYEDRVGEIVVEENRFSELDARLVRSTGTLRILTEPSVVAWQVRGAETAEKGQGLQELKLPTGHYEVVFSREGWRESRAQVDIKRNEAVQLLGDLAGGMLSLETSLVGVAWELRDAKGVILSAGKTPTARMELPVGHYEVSFKRSGWPEQGMSVDIKKNESTLAFAEFPAGRMHMLSEPAGAEVWINGALAGKTPLATQEYPAGMDLAVQIKLPGYRRWEQTVRLTGDNEVTINTGVLIPLSGAIKLHFAHADYWTDSAPPTLLLDGTELRDVRFDPAVITLAGIKPGRHTLEVHHPDFWDWTQVLNIADGDQLDMTADPAPKPAHLAVTVNPQVSCSVRINGNAVAFYPSRANDLELPLGKDVKIEISARGYAKVERDFTLKANQREVWNVELAALPPGRIKVAWSTTGRSVLSAVGVLGPVALVPLLGRTKGVNHILLDGREVGSFSGALGDMSWTSDDLVEGEYKFDVYADRPGNVPPRVTIPFGMVGVRPGEIALIYLDRTEITYEMIR